MSDAEALARRVADAMYSRDRASQGLGIRIARIGPGHAELTMTVRSDMVNGFPTKRAANDRDNRSNPSGRGVMEVA